MRISSTGLARGAFAGGQGPACGAAIRDTVILGLVPAKR
jgi:hypothetical protein